MASRNHLRSTVRVAILSFSLVTGPQISAAQDEYAAQDPVYTPLLRLADRVEHLAARCDAVACPSVDCEAYGRLLSSWNAIRTLTGPTEWLSVHSSTLYRWDGRRITGGDDKTLGYWLALARESAAAALDAKGEALVRNGRRKETVDLAMLAAKTMAQISRLAQMVGDLWALKDFAAGAIEKANQPVLAPGSSDTDILKHLMSEVGFSLDAIDAGNTLIAAMSEAQTLAAEMKGIEGTKGIELPEELGKTLDLVGTIGDAKAALDFGDWRQLVARQQGLLAEYRSLMRAPGVKTIAEIEGRSARAKALLGEAAEVGKEAGKLREAVAQGIGNLALTVLTPIAERQIAKLEDEAKELVEVMAAEERTLHDSAAEWLAHARRNEALMQAMERMDAVESGFLACAAMCPGISAAAMAEVPRDRFYSEVEPGRRVPSYGTAIAWFDAELQRHMVAAGAALDMLESAAGLEGEIAFGPEKPVVAINEAIRLNYSGPQCLMNDAFVEAEAGGEHQAVPSGQGALSFAGRPDQGSYVFNLVAPAALKIIRAEVFVAGPPALAEGSSGILEPRSTAPVEVKCDGGYVGMATVTLTPHWRSNGAVFNVHWYEPASAMGRHFQSTAEQMPGCQGWTYDQNVEEVRVTFDVGGTLASDGEPGAEFAIPQGATRVTRIELDYEWGPLHRIVWSYE